MKYLFLVLPFLFLGCSRYTLISSRYLNYHNGTCAEENWWIDEQSALKEPVKRVIEVPCR